MTNKKDFTQKHVQKSCSKAYRPGAYCTEMTTDNNNTTSIASYSLF